MDKLEKLHKKMTAIKESLLKGDMDDTIKRNIENKKRMAADRSKANDKVKQSHNLKTPEKSTAQSNDEAIAKPSDKPLPPKPKSSQQSGSGFKLKLIKALADSGQHPSAMLLKNWGEYDENAIMMKGELEKSNYGPKELGLYNELDNMKRKSNNTQEEHKDAGKNKNVKKYTTSGASAQKVNENNQQAAQDEKTAASLKTMSDFSPDKIKEMEAKANAPKKV